MFHLLVDVLAHRFSELLTQDHRFDHIAELRLCVVIGLEHIRFEVGVGFLVFLGCHRRVRIGHCLRRRDRIGRRIAIIPHHLLDLEIYLLGVGHQAPLSRRLPYQFLFHHLI